MHYLDLVLNHNEVFSTEDGGRLPGKNLQFLFVPVLQINSPGRHHLHGKKITLHYCEFIMKVREY